MFKKSLEELESDARKAVADFTKGPRGSFLLGLSNWVNLHLAGSRGKDKALYQQHRTIQ
jgi:hypothetical protein